MKDVMKQLLTQKQSRTKNAVNEKLLASASEFWPWSG